jgi:hypothetical protein
LHVVVQGMTAVACCQQGNIQQAAITACQTLAGPECAKAKFSDKILQRPGKIACLIEIDLGFIASGTSLTRLILYRPCFTSASRTSM